MLEYMMMNEWSVYFYKKALLLGEDLYQLRKKEYPLYQALLAPLYYQYGAALATYIEVNLTRKGFLKPFKLPRECNSELKQR